MVVYMWKNILILFCLFLFLSCTEEKEPINHKKMKDSEIMDHLTPEEYKLYLRAKNKSKEEGNIDSFKKLSIKEIIENEKKNNISKLDIERKEQIEYLEKIINRDIQKIDELEIKISQGDTSDIQGAKEYLNDMKNALQRKQKRLEEIK